MHTPETAPQTLIINALGGPLFKSHCLALAYTIQNVELHSEKDRHVIFKEICDFLKLDPQAVLRTFPDFLLEQIEQDMRIRVVTASGMDSSDLVLALRTLLGRDRVEAPAAREERGTSDATIQLIQQVRSRLSIAA